MSGTNLPQFLPTVCYVHPNQKNKSFEILKQWDFNQCHRASECHVFNNHFKVRMSKTLYLKVYVLSDFFQNYFSFWNCRPFSPVDKLLQVAFDIYLIVCSLVNNKNTLFLVRCRRPVPPSPPPHRCTTTRIIFLQIQIWFCHSLKQQPNKIYFGIQNIKSIFLSLASKTLYNLCIVLCATTAVVVAISAYLYSLCVYTFLHTQNSSHRK